MASDLHRDAAGRARGALHKLLAPDSISIKIIAPPERQHLAWTGAAEMARASNLEGMWVTQDEYRNMGPKILHKKFR